MLAFWGPIGDLTYPFICLTIVAFFEATNVFNMRRL